MLTLNGFTISLWIYFIWSWKMLRCFLHMIFPNSNHKSFSKYLQCCGPVNISTTLSILSNLDQFHNYSIVTFFVDRRVHWYPASPFSNFLHSGRTCLYFWAIPPLRMRSVYLIRLSTSISDAIHRCSNTLTIRYCIGLITTGPSWSNILKNGNFLFIRFLIVAIRIYSSMTRI